MAAVLAGQAVSTLRRSEKPDGQSYGNQSGAQGKKQKSDRKEKAFLQHAFGVDVAVEDVLEQQRDRAGDEGGNAGHLNFERHNLILPVVLGDHIDRFNDENSCKAAVF